MSDWEIGVQAPRRLAWPTLALAVAVFAGGASMRCLDALLPVLAADFGRSIGMAGGAVSAYAISYGAFQLFYGPLGDRLGAYRVVAAAVCLAALTAAACALATTLPALIALRFLTGAIAGAVGPMALAWVSRSTSVAERPVAFTRITAAAILGAAAGQIGGGVFDGWVGWRFVFVVTAMMFAVAGLALILIARRSPDVLDHNAAGSTTAPPPSLSLLRRPMVVQVLIAVGCEGFAVFLSLTYVGAMLRDRLALGPTHAGFVISLYGIGGMAFVLSARRLLRMTGIAGRAVSAGAILGLGFGSLALQSSEVAAALALFAIGFGYLMLHNVLQVLAAEMAPDALVTALSLFAAASCLAQALGAAAGGFLFDRIGPAPGYWMSGAMLIGLGGVIAIRHQELAARNPIGQKNS